MTSAPCYTSFLPCAGVLDPIVVRDVLARESWLLPDWELNAMFALALSGGAGAGAGARQVGSVQFLRLFQDVQLIDE